MPGLDTHPSGVLAVVVAGLLLGHKSHLIQSASSRLFERTNWATISFVLENVVFLLIGLQIRGIVNALGDDELSLGRVAAASALVLVGVIVLRMVVGVPGHLPAADDPRGPAGRSAAAVDVPGGHRVGRHARRGHAGRGVPAAREHRAPVRRS